MAGPSQLDPVSVVVAVAAFLFGSQAAEAAGAYFIIAAAALLGAGFGAGNAGETTGWQSFWRIFGAVGFACFWTVPICLLIEHFSKLEARWFFAGVAFFIGFRSRMLVTDLTRVFRFFVSAAAGWISDRAKNQEPPK